MESKSCKNCEFNFGGICTEDGLYGYGKEISDDSKCCDAWGADLDYFEESINNAPRFLQEALNDCSISYSEFEKRLDDFEANRPVKINIFDAVKLIYGISMVDIAVLLDVSFGVVYNAKIKGFTEKRLVQFSNCLCLEANVLLNTTTLSFDEMRLASKSFWENNKHSIVESVPEWKNNLALLLSTVFNCPFDLAKQISRVDKIYWTSEMSLDEFTESEQIFINYIVDSKKPQKVCEIKYSLDIGCKPKCKIRVCD